MLIRASRDEALGELNLWILDSDRKEIIAKQIKNAHQTPIQSVWRTTLQAQGACFNDWLQLTAL